MLKIVRKNSNIRFPNTITIAGSFSIANSVITASPAPHSASAINILLYEFLNNLLAIIAPKIEPAAPIDKSVA